MMRVLVAVTLDHLRSFSTRRSVDLLSQKVVEYRVTGESVTSSDYETTFYSFDSVDNKASVGVYQKTDAGVSSQPETLTIKAQADGSAKLYDGATEYAVATLSDAAKAFLDSSKSKSGTVIFGRWDENGNFSGVSTVQSLSVDSTGRRVTIMVVQMQGVPAFYDFVGMGVGEHADKGIYRTTIPIAQGMLGFYAGFTPVTSGNKGAFYRGVWTVNAHGETNPKGGQVDSEQDFKKIFYNTSYEITFK